MLGQLLIAEMRDSQALASCQHAFLQAMGELSRPQVPRALQAGALNGRMLQSRCSIWWVHETPTAVDVQTEDEILA